MKKHPELIACLFLFFGFTIKAQVVPDTYLNTESANEVVKVYTDSIGKYQNLLYGQSHVTYIANLKNRYYPYLQPKGYIFEYSVFSEPVKQTSDLKEMGYDEGKLLYDGILYPKLNMRLDLLQNQLVVLAPDLSYNVIVDPDKVEWAELFGYHLIYKNKNNSGVKNFPGEGYYLELFAGEGSVLKRDSYYQIKRPGEVFINRSVKYYFLKENVYYQVKNKKSLLNALRSHKKELEQYIRDNRISFDKDNFEDAIVSVVKYHEKF